MESDSCAGGSDRDCPECGRQMARMDIGGAIVFDCLNDVCPNMDFETEVYDSRQYSMNLLEARLGLDGDPPQIIQHRSERNNRSHHTDSDQ